MSYYKKILICGGDKRQKYMYEIMKDKGLEVSTFGLGDESVVTLSDLNKFDVIILPVPVSKDGVNLNAPLVNYQVKLEDIFSGIDKSQTVLGGVCDKFGDNLIDYYKSEDFQMKNAVPTAEGALQIAMENTDITINKSHCAVLGFGRIGKIMAAMLKRMGAFVTVCARNPKDIMLAQVFGFDTVNIDEVFFKADNFDIIFNTVPKTVIDVNVLEKIKDSALIIELASKPYGIDMEAAEKLGKNVIVASALPGKVAPRTAGKILCDVIMNILIGLEV